MATNVSLRLGKENTHMDQEEWELISEMLKKKISELEASANHWLAERNDIAAELDKQMAENKQLMNENEDLWKQARDRDQMARSLRIYGEERKRFLAELSELRDKLKAAQQSEETLVNALRIYADRNHWHPQYPSFYVGPRYSEPWTVAQRVLPDSPNDTVMMKLLN